MDEHNLIVIAEDITDETVLAVLAAIQSFEKAAVDKNNGWNRIHQVTRNLNFYTYLQCPQRYVFIFEKCLSTLAAVNENIPKVDFTYVGGLSIASAKAIAHNTDKPLALAFGILLGCEANTLADVTNLQSSYSENLDLIVDISLVKVCGENLEEMQFYSSDLATLIEKIDIVFRSKIVVGYSSFETYLGCCLNKPVLEIQLDPSLYKWNSKAYYCITEESNLKELVPKGIQLCLTQI